MIADARPGQELLVVRLFGESKSHLVILQDQFGTFKAPVHAHLTLIGVAAGLGDSVITDCVGTGVDGVVTVVSKSLDGNGCVQPYLVVVLGEHCSAADQK